MKTILMTGAAGGARTFLRRELAEYSLRLSDVRVVTDLGDNETFVASDLTELEAVTAAAEGCDGIIHLGGMSDEQPWEDILNANIVGCRNVYEAARTQGVKRVIFASSNHAVGFYRRDETISVDVTTKPDTRYGVSKAFGEAMGSLYADKYGVGGLAIRIGNVDQRPADVRRLAIWLSPRDLAQLVRIGLEHPQIHFEIVYGMSDNKRSWWDNANATRLGYQPSRTGPRIGPRKFWPTVPGTPTMMLLRPIRVAPLSPWRTVAAACPTFASSHGFDCPCAPYYWCRAVD